MLFVSLFFFEYHSLFFPEYFLLSSENFRMLRENLLISSVITSYMAENINTMNVNVHPMKDKRLLLEIIRFVLVIIVSLLIVFDNHRFLIPIITLIIIILTITYFKNELITFLHHG